MDAAEPLVASAPQPRVIAAELAELAPELTPTSAEMLVTEGPNASGTALAEMGLVLATRGFDSMPRAQLDELTQLFEEVYAKLSAADRERMGAYMRTLRDGSLSPEQSATGRRLLTQGVTKLPEGRRRRLQALLEAAIRAGIESRRQAETRARLAALAPAPEPPPRETPSPAPQGAPSPIPVAGTASGAADGGRSDTRGEAYWRSRIQQARGRVTRLKTEIAQLEHTARGEIYGPGLEPVCIPPERITPASEEQYLRCVKLKQNWPLRQRADQAARLERVARLRQELAEAERAVGEIEDEARRAGALPGWLRE